MQNKKYHPSLSNWMNLCEVNYMLLVRLLASNNDEEIIGDKRSFFISDFLSYQTEIMEVTRYTTLVNISQNLPYVKKTADEDAQENDNQTSSIYFRFLVLSN